MDIDKEKNLMNCPPLFAILSISQPAAKLAKS